MRAPTFATSHFAARCFPCKVTAERRGGRRTAVIASSSSYPTPKRSSEEKKAAKQLVDDADEGDLDVDGWSEGLGLT